MFEAKQCGFELREATVRYTVLTASRGITLAVELRMTVWLVDATIRYLLFAEQRLC